MPRTGATKCSLLVCALRTARDPNKNLASSMVIASNSPCSSRPLGDLASVFALLSASLNCSGSEAASAFAAPPPPKAPPALPGDDDDDDDDDDDGAAGGGAGGGDISSTPNPPSTTTLAAWASLLSFPALSPPFVIVSAHFCRRFLFLSLLACAMRAIRYVMSRSSSSRCLWISSLQSFWLFLNCSSTCARLRL